ncbi:SGNH/GDSL hydrolase family protein [Streptomyces pactum]|uniref:SGNH/GDSL hydrolase family protein n=1 Tax=Streptomyces pactum TaxID=68249 RepID=A0ABS0NIU5_9ACTN|nr:SGNH/GDSL hydrolase family protein [Streptomyces pactum]MBH5335105.1 SGNH/GDSL hydrolase family protein [Streptomyces pactum]
MSVPTLPRRPARAVFAVLAAVAVLVPAAIHLSPGGGPGVRSAAAPPAPGAVAPASSGAWVGTWATAPSAPEPRSWDGYAGMSIRNVVHTSIGGTGVRIHLSNLYGARPLAFTHVSVAVAATDGGPAAVPGTLRRLTFAARTSVTVPAGRTTVSDPVPLTVPAAADLLVSTYSPAPSGPVTYHPHARQTSYLARGEHTLDHRGTAYTEQSPSWRYLAAVDVRSEEAQGAVAVLGDSITDGVTSTPGANHRWPDFLAARLRDEPGAPRYGVLNAGISGNRVLTDGNPYRRSNPSGLSRFERDVLARAGVRAVVIELGINDILRDPRLATGPEPLLAGLRQLTRQAHARGLRVTGGTLTPFQGYRRHRPGLEELRQRVNREIRAGTVFDAVVDFDRALRDPARPLRLLPAYDSGDHLHPSDAGYRAMAHALDLDVLAGRAAAAL